jgi:RHS repeat-associated protein
LKSRFTNHRVPFIVTHGWDENSIKYDVNGNIQALRRDSSVQGTLTANSGILKDQLKYTYNTSIPDQLYTVYDSSGSAKGFIGGATGSHYTYDANGNLTSEPYQGITGITYNVLNRTDSTKISGTTYITYTYNAAGMLLRKKAYNSGTLTQTDYIGGFVYTGNGSTQTLAYVPMPEGRLIGATLTQEYVITDPQGNARVAFQNVSGVAKVTQENSYYCYGLLMPGSLVGWSAPPNKNPCNGGSEWQNDTKAVNAGVPNYYQTFYRNYDPALARFVAVDPMAEGAESMGVFQYAGDNPIMGNDPGGDKACVSCTMGGGGLAGPTEFDQEIAQEGAEMTLADNAEQFVTCGCGPLAGTPGYFSWNSSDASGASSPDNSTPSTNNASQTNSASGTAAGSTNQTGSTDLDSTTGPPSAPPSDGALPPIPGIMLQGNVTIQGVATGADLIDALGTYLGGDSIRGIHVIYEYETPTIYKILLTRLKVDYRTYCIIILASQPSIGRKC